MASVPKIAIIGAGPAGLTLARLLLVSKVKVDIRLYEIDVSATSRPDQGGTLDLHDDTGLAAIRKCDLWELFRRYARYEGKEMIIRDKNATPLVHIGGGETGGKGDRPEIDRQKLKEILVESLPVETIQWGRKLKEVTADGRLKFEGRDELEGPFDLVVGADGAWSKVRARLHAVKPVYSGVSGYELVIREPSKTCPELNRRVGRGSVIGSSDCKALNTQRMGDDSLKVRSWYLTPEGEAKESLAKFGKQKTLKKIKERYTGWAPEMTEALDRADLETLTPWTLYELPLGTYWDHQKGFTLMGDAASLATPFSGEGVNKAMKDALELAELLELSQDDTNGLTMDEAVRRYEVSMIKRSAKLQRMTMVNKQAFFGPAAPIGLFIGMIETMAGDHPSLFVRMFATRPVTALVYGYFWVRQQIGLAVRTYWRGT